MPLAIATDAAHRNKTRSFCVRTMKIFLSHAIVSNSINFLKLEKKTKQQTAELIYLVISWRIARTQNKIPKMIVETNAAFSIPLRA